MRTFATIGISFAAGALVVGAFVFGRATAPTARRADWAGPLVLEKVQALGDLHTVRHRYAQTFESSSAMEPAGAAGHLPGAPELIRATTTNVALVTANGAVEAGVDLRKARVEGGVIVLPRAKIYPVRVDVSLHDAKRGLFWRDASLPIRATHEAERRFRSAAETAGIRVAAEREAAARVERLVREAGSKMAVRVEA